MLQGVQISFPSVIGNKTYTCKFAERMNTNSCMNIQPLTETVALCSVQIGLVTYSINKGYNTVMNVTKINSN